MSLKNILCHDRSSKNIWLSIFLGVQFKEFLELVALRSSHFSPISQLLMDIYYFCEVVIYDFLVFFSCEKNAGNVNLYTIVYNFYFSIILAAQSREWLVVVVLQISRLLLVCWYLGELGNLTKYDDTYLRLR